MRLDLDKAFYSVRDGAVDIKAAAEMSNIVGKIIGTIKVELEYHAMRKEDPNIKYLSDKSEPDADSEGTPR